MSQLALTETIIKTLGLENDSKQHKTPAVSPPLNKYEDSEPFNEKWSYISLISMLTYLARNTRPDIEYLTGVHQGDNLDPPLFVLVFQAAMESLELTNECKDIVKPRYKYLPNMLTKNHVED